MVLALKFLIRSIEDVEEEESSKTPKGFVLGVVGVGGFAALSCDGTLNIFPFRRTRIMEAFSSFEAAGRPTAGEREISVDSMFLG